MGRSFNVIPSQHRTTSTCAARRAGLPAFLLASLPVWLLAAPPVERSGPDGPRPLGLEGHKEEKHDPPALRTLLDQRGTSPGATIVRGRFTSFQVNVDSDGNNIVGDAANEPSIAIDPTNPSFMAIGWRQFDTITSNFRQAGNAFSQDGGQTWTFPGVLDPGQFRSDPVLGADADGIFYYSSLSSLSSIEVFRSFDGGATWGMPVPAFGGDKQWITVDRTGGTGRGNLYQIWNIQFSCCGQTDFTRSTDNGLSFEGPFQVGPPSMKWGTMDVDPDGRLFLAGSTLNQASHLVSRSSDAQDPSVTPSYDFVRSIDLGGVTSFSAGPNPAGLLGQVWVKIDPSSGPSRGNVYVLASVDPPGPDPLDVMFIRSTDGGDTWSTPVRVNDDAADTLAWQWFGTMSVAPNGRIDVVWNDTRNSGVSNQSETFYAFSMDAGSTWSQGVPITPMFDSHVGWPQQNKLGDYYDMISDADGANLAYAATFNGEQDVYFIRIEADCNDNGISDSEDIIAGTSEDCDGNGIPDECQADCNANLIPDTCDIAAGTSEDCSGDGIPDECATGFGCHSISIIEDGPPCLETQVTLVGVNERGIVTIADGPPPAIPVILERFFNSILPFSIDISALADVDWVLCISAMDELDGVPESITFEMLNSSCGPGGQFEFFLNDVSMGTVDADPTDGCTCGVAVQTFPVVDPGLLAAWTVGGPNTLRVVMTGGSENLAWVRAHIERGALAGTICIFDTGSDCEGTGLCNHALVPSPVDSSVLAEFEIRTACRGFTKQGEAVMTMNSPCEPCAVTADAPLPEAAAVTKNRYLSVEPTNPGTATGLQFTLVASAAFPTLVGESWWAGPPQTVCENSGQIAEPAEGCGPSGSEPATIQVASLQCERHCADWNSTGLVHIVGRHVVPDAIYEVRAINCACATNDPAAFSAPLPISTSLSGDVCGPAGQTVCASGPEGTVDVTNDVLGVLDKFSNQPSGVSKTRADLTSTVAGSTGADLIVDVIDVLRVLNEFRNLPITLVGPVACP